MADLQGKDVTVKFRYCFFSARLLILLLSRVFWRILHQNLCGRLGCRLEEEETSCYSNDGNRLHHRRHTYYMFFNVSTLVLEFKKSRVGVKDVREAFVCMSICHHQFFKRIITTVFLRWRWAMMPWTHLVILCLVCRANGPSAATPPVRSILPYLDSFHFVVSSGWNIYSTVSSIIFLIDWQNKCFDAVGWAAERASGL